MLLALVFSALTLAQSIPSMLLPSGAPSLSLGAPGIKIEGVYATAPITLDGNMLFRVAVPVGSDPVGAQAAVAERQATIEAVFAQLTAGVSSGTSVGTVYSPESLALSITTEGPEDVIEVSDHNHGAIPILTVTTADAKYRKMSVAALAASWKDTKLQPALLTALLNRQPAEVKRNGNVVGRVAVALALLTVLLWMLHAALGRRMVAVYGDVESSAALEGTKRHLEILRAIRAILVWAGIFMWVGAAMWAITLFPELLPAGSIVAHRIRLLIFIWVGCGVLDRVLELVIVRVAAAYERPSLERSAYKARLALRAPTVARAANGFKTFLLIFIAVSVTLTVIGISTSSAITLSGILALALTFAAQNLVRDFLNGCLVLLEDQFVVGDYIQVGEWSGIVENLTLRIVQIRDGRGNLITIPHSSVIQVVNSSRNWSRIDYRVAIAPTANLEVALKTLRSTIETLAAEPEWHSAILQAIEWSGIESVSQNGVVLRASVKTAPLRQFEVRRAINLRIVEALGAAGVALGSDPGTVVVNTPVGSPDPN